MKYSTTLACLTAHAATTFADGSWTAPPPFNWTAVTAQTYLDYHPCYDGFECARLTLPLDYHDSSNPHNISLAVIRLPATVPEDDPNHGGSIILNPGGPGGSGVWWSLSVAQRLQHGLSIPGGKQFEIVSFDPRGMMNSKPNMYCFATPFDAQLWEHEKLSKGALDAGEDALEWQWQFELARGRICEESDVGKWDDGTDIRRYVGTAYVATDMLELVKAVDARKTNTLLQSLDSLSQAPMHPESDSVPKIQYYGQSYGTFLGQLFASMYPEHVGRMIMDANIDGDNWTSDHEYSVDDAETIRAYFFEACFAAGRRCAFWALTDEFAKDQESRYKEMVARLSRKPAPIINGRKTILLTPERLEKAFFSVTYQPSADFPRLAQLLLDVYNHLEYGEPLEDIDSFWETSTPTLEDFASEELAHVLQNVEVAAFVHCADAPDLTDHNISSFKWHLDDLLSKFPHVGAEQALYKLPCWTMAPSLRTPWRYEGPFGSYETPPILFLNNRLDAATPAKSARKMASRFEGSKLVVSGNFGHAALWRGGDCVWNHARRYMVDGVLPEEKESWCDALQTDDAKVTIEQHQDYHIDKSVSSKSDEGLSENQPRQHHSLRDTMKILVGFRSLVMPRLTRGLDMTKVVEVHVPASATKRDLIVHLEIVLFGRGSWNQHELFKHGRRGQWGWDLWAKGPEMDGWKRMEEGEDIGSFVREGDQRSVMLRGEICYDPEYEDL